MKSIIKLFFIASIVITLGACIIAKLKSTNFEIKKYIFLVNKESEFLDSLSLFLIKRFLNNV